MRGFKLKAPDMFTGKDRSKTESFVERLKVYALSTGTPDGSALVSAASSYLAEDAHSWWLLRQRQVAEGQATPITRLAEFCAAVKAQFRPLQPEATARKTLISLKQGAGPGSLMKYVDTFNEAERDLPQMSGDDKIWFFINGLRPEIRVQVELQRPVTLLEAQKMAAIVDGTMLNLGVGAVVLSSVPVQAEGNGSAVPMDLNAMQTTAVVAGKDGKVHARIECFKCKRMGHFQSQCPGKNARR